MMTTLELDGDACADLHTAIGTRLEGVNGAIKETEEAIRSYDFGPGESDPRLDRRLAGFKAERIRLLALSETVGMQGPKKTKIVRGKAQDLG